MWVRIHMYTLNWTAHALALISYLCFSLCCLYTSSLHSIYLLPSITFPRLFSSLIVNYSVVFDMWHFLSARSHLLLWHMELRLSHMTCESSDIWNLGLLPSFSYMPSPFTSPFSYPILLCSFQLHHLPLTWNWSHLSSHHIFSCAFPTSSPRFLHSSQLNSVLFSQCNLLLWRRCWKS